MLHLFQLLWFQGFFRFAKRDQVLVGDLGERYYFAYKLPLDLIPLPFNSASQIGKNKWQCYNYIIGASIHPVQIGDPWFKEQKRLNRESAGQFIVPLIEPFRTAGLVFSKYQFCSLTSLSSSGILRIFRSFRTFRPFRSLRSFRHSGHFGPSGHFDPSGHFVPAVNPVLTSVISVISAIQVVPVISSFRIIFNMRIEHPLIKSHVFI